MSSLPQIVLMCKGPGAAEAIRGNTQMGWLLFAACVVVLVINQVLLKKLRGRFFAQWPVVLVVALHPGWWMSARGGDCGALLYMGSVLATVVVVPLSAFVLWRAHRARKGSQRLDD